MQALITQFSDRQALIHYVQNLTHAADATSSPQLGGQRAAQPLIVQLDLEAYSKDRNFLSGHVSRLSPYIRHGIVSVAELSDQLAKRYPAPVRARFIQQLAWRDYFHQVDQAQPDQVWLDCEAYKTGFNATEYADLLPEDIATGVTGVRVVDQMIQQLITEGYLHNHARLYLASYIVHWRRVKWQAGAQWFLRHLLDGDIASNNYSWQWVASTFSAKPYIFNLDNLRRFAGSALDCGHVSNQFFDLSYDALSASLFPNLLQESSQ